MIKTMDGKTIDEHPGIFGARSPAVAEPGESRVLTAPAGPEILIATNTVASVMTSSGADQNRTRGLSDHLGHSPRTVPRNDGELHTRLRPRGSRI